MPICFKLFWHFMRLAASRTFCTAGKRRPTSTPMMANTTSSSMSVNPRRRGEDMTTPQEKGGRRKPSDTGGRGHVDYWPAGRARQGKRLRQGEKDKGRGQFRPVFA